MGSSPSTPNIPNWQDVGNVQQQVNTQSGLQSQSGSMVNQYNPFGSLTYTQTGVDQYGNPRYSSSMQYNPQTAALFGLGQYGAGAMGSAVPGFAGAAQGTLPYAGVNYGLAQNTAGQSNALLGTGLGTIASGNYGAGNNVGQQTQGLTNQIMGNYATAMSPFYNMQTNWLDTSLQNRGIMPGTDAYNNAMLQNNYGQGLQAANLAAQVEPAAYGQAVSQYSLPATLGESLMQSGIGTGQLGQGYSNTGYGANASAIGLLGGAGAGLGGLQGYTPGLNSTMYNTPGLNISPASYISSANTYDQAVMQQYQAQMAQQNAMWSALGGLGGGLLGGWARGGFANPFG